MDPRVTSVTSSSTAPQSASCMLILSLLLTLIALQHHLGVAEAPALHTSIAAGAAGSGGA